MGLTNYKGRLINDDRYIYPFPEIIIQTTRNVVDIQHLGFGDASNDNGYIYFYADADWKENPAVYIGESKNSLQSRHSATHKSTAWFKAIQYPFIGIVNSPDKPWDTDTRRAIESLTVHKAHAAGFQIVNSTNSTWTNGGTVHPNVNRKYVDDVSEIIVQYLVHHTGWVATHKKESGRDSNNVVKQAAPQSIKNETIHGDASPALPSTAGQADVGTRAPKQRYETTLLDLINANLLKAGDILYSTERLYPGTAILEESGRLSFNGESGLSLSTAGEKCRNIVNPGVSRPNGWEFWATKDSQGNLTKLVRHRATFLASLSGD
jgi:hypothetical protein